MLMASLFLVLGTAWAQQQMALNSMPSQVLTSLEDVSADKYFVMQTADEYGMNLWLKDNGGDSHQMKVDNQLTPQEASSSNYLWKITKSGENYQVQNVGTGRYFPTFVKNANPSTVEFANAGSFTLVDRSADGEGKWNFKNSGDAVCLNVSGWWGYTTANPVGWDSQGGNSNYKVFVADVIDLSALVTVPFNYFVGEEWVAYREAKFVVNSPVTLGDVPTLTYYQNYTFKEAGDKFAADWVGINISCETNFPFIPELGKKYALKSEAGTYFSFNTPTDGTGSAASFSDTPTYFYITVSNTGYTFVDCENAERYIGMNGGWNVGTSSAKWYISVADANGYVTISRTTEGGNLGHNEKWTAGTGIFTNVNSSCNKWLLEVEVAPLPAVGDYIRLQNRAKGGYMKAMDDAMIRRTEDKSDLATLWLVEEGTNGSVKLKNVSTQKYVGNIAESADVKMVESNNAAQLTFSNIDEAYCAFQVTGGNYRTFANMNEWNGVFKVVGWQNDDHASQWVSSQAYPLTVVYKIGNVVDSEETVYVDAGESYTIDTKDQTVVSCVTDKGEVVVIDGVYTIPAVNGATTVTVTLEGVEEPEAPVVPEAGKAFVFKEKSSGLYLDIRTLGIKDGDRNTNNISLSSKPYPIYLESGSADGKWKMKNANGLYVFHNPINAGSNGHWNPEIGEQSSEWSISKLNDGGFTIARAADGKYLNVDTKAAGKPLYCDKASGMQFELLDYENVDFIIGAGLGKEGAEGPYVAIKEIDADGTTTTLPVGMGWILTVEVENPNGASHGQWGSSILATGKEPFPYKNKHNGFQLYLQSGTNGAKKLDVVFSNADHIVNNVSYTGDFKAVITYDGTSKLDVVTTNAAGTEETNNYTISLPAISEFAYGLPTGINIKRLSIETIEREYTFVVGTKPDGQDVTVTYGDEAIEAGAIIKESELDLLKFAATEVPGYSWAVVADKAANTLTLNYTQAEVADLQAVKDLVNRIGGEGTADKFMFVHTPWLNSKQETFILGAQDGKIRIEGSTISAITTGIGWYLNNIAHINIAWNSLNEKTVAVKENGAAYADLSNLPLPSQTETHTSDAKYRYYLNTCTFGYSMTSWTWTRWQQEIDWMALHGINMPLQLVGLEEVWRTFLIKCGYSESDAKAFVAGPAFIAWWAMNNLQGWGGTDPGTKSGGTWAGAGGVQDDAWYARQTKLAKQIVEAQRGLGMQPVLPGWSGMVPTNFASKSAGKYATRGNGGNWAGDFVRPLLLNTSIGADKYAKIAADYYECLHAVMGESQYYSMDPFHEGGGAGTMADYEYMYAAMEAAKPGSQWVIQQWQWSATQKYSLTAVPEGRLIVLDLFSDGSPAFDGYNGYAPQEAVFCAIPNFGGRSGLMGRLQNVTDNYFKFKGKYASIKGVGTAPEAIEQTPVAYDLIYQLPWMNGVKPDVAKWVENYAVARYGKDNKIVKEAWSLLRQGPLNYGADGIQGPVEDVWAARPNLNANAASFWGKTLNNGTASNTYTKERRQMLIDAVYKLISQKDILNLKEGSIYESNYMYDLVEFGGAVMADYAYDLLLGIRDAKNAGNNALYEARRDAFLQLILDMDAFRGTNLNFRLGKWTQEARAAAAEVEGATTATPDWYEYNNARTILSTWSSPNTNLKDYSYRSWQGLLKDYYYPRWKYYFENNCTDAEYGYFEWNWAHGMKHEVGQTAVSNVPLAPGEAGHTDSYTREPEGNTVEAARAMLRKYIIPIHMNDGTTYYAYRTFTYDLKDKVIINVPAGSTVDFTHYLNVPADATITGDFINSNEPVSITSVPVKDDEAMYTATITLADGTVLSNFTVHTPKFDGVYKINLVTDWGNTPVFVQYNENDNVPGYKMVATSNGYSTDSELDKWFSITSSGEGYKVSVQGKYLKAPTVWEYVLFSENVEEAGSYLFDDSDTHGIYKIVAVDGSHLQAWSYVMADVPGDAGTSTFTFEKMETYSVTMSSDGYAPVYLPFNVILPEGVEAYDVCGHELVNDSKDQAEGALEKIASSGNILKAGTPTVLKGDPGLTYELPITMSNNNAKGGLPYSVLRGSYEKHTLVHTEGIKKFVLHEKHFDDLQTYYKRVLENEEGEAVVEMPANTCWLEANIEADQIGLTEGSYVKIDDWLILYENRPKGILLSSIAVSGEGGALVIPKTYNINGEEKQIVAISEDFFENNTEITSVTLPATLSDVGASKLTLLEQITYHGFAESKMGEVGQFINTGMNTPISGDNTWRMTVAVKIDSETIDFNEWGSAILATKEETLADYYDDGSMQLYLKNDHDSIIFKLDNADDRYTFCYSNPDGTTLVNDTFTFVLDNDGSGGYDAKVIFANGKEQVHAITARDKAELKLFRNIFSSMPEGMHVTVTFEDKVNDGLFVGCTNLREIIVADDSESFTSIDGVLYSKDGTHIIRFPEGATGAYDIDKKVTRLNPGSLHGVNADITFHSNPKILFVADHEEHMMARYYLSLEDADKVDFESDNTNTFETVRYERAPLAKEKFGTFFLPFVPENIMDKYDFFELVGGDNTGLVFSQVEKVEANKPYLYTLKEDATNGNGNDVFTAGKTTIVSVGDSVHVGEGEWKAFGTYRNDYVLTSNYKDSYYYYLSASSGMFHRVTQRLDLRPFRAYFVWVPETTEGQTIQAAPKLALRFSNGSTTEISPEQVEGWEETPVYYDLMGRRVENPIDGVYIVNGKKVVIR